MQQRLQPPFFPIPLEHLQGCIGFYDFLAGDTLAPAEGLVLRTARLTHPGGAAGYRVEDVGRVACYVTDTKHEEGRLDRKLIALSAGADVVISDSTYTDEEFPRCRDWGHSTGQKGLRLCAAAHAGRLVAFHHDPERDDEALDAIALELALARPGSPAAREGLVLRL